jgi:hypothetical protein
LAEAVQAPTRRPRQGGIKTVAGDYVSVPRIGVANGTGGLVWEDSGCGFPKATRAGCYDDTIAPGVNEVQRLTITGDPTGGTFTLDFLSQDTAAINFDAVAADVQAALEDLPNVDPGDITVTGGPGPGTPFTFTFGGNYAYQDVAQMTVTPAFTGGTAPAAAVTTITVGGRTLKTADGVTGYTTIGDPVARYAGVECFIGGDTVGDSYEQQARTLLSQGEDREIEALLWGWAAAAATPGAAASVDEAIGLAEQYADTHYVGAPILLMSRAAAVAGDEAGVLHRDGDRLVTTNGNWVLATGAVPDEDLLDVIAIGAVAVYASDATSYTALEHTENMALAIAERIYAVGVDCTFRYAVTVTAP